MKLFLWSFSILLLRAKRRLIEPCLIILCVFFQNRRMDWRTRRRSCCLNDTVMMPMSLYQNPLPRFSLLGAQIFFSIAYKLIENHKGKKILAFFFFFYLNLENARNRFSFARIFCFPTFSNIG